MRHEIVRKRLRANYQSSRASRNKRQPKTIDSVLYRFENSFFIKVPKSILKSTVSFSILERQKGQAERATYDRFLKRDFFWVWFSVSFDISIWCNTYQVHCWSLRFQLRNGEELPSWQEFVRYRIDFDLITKNSCAWSRTYPKKNTLPASKK